MSATRLRELRDQYDMLPSMRINIYDEVVFTMESDRAEYIGINKDEDLAIAMALADIEVHFRESAQERMQREQEYAAGRGV